MVPFLVRWSILEAWQNRNRIQNKMQNKDYWMSPRLDGVYWGHSPDCPMGRTALSLLSTTCSTTSSSSGTSSSLSSATSSSSTKSLSHQKSHTSIVIAFQRKCNLWCQELKLQISRSESGFVWSSCVMDCPPIPAMSQTKTNINDGVSISTSININISHPAQFYIRLQENHRRADSVSRRVASSHRKLPSHPHFEKYLPTMIGRIFWEMFLAISY